MAAQRYGGAYSPDGKGPDEDEKPTGGAFRGTVPSRVGGRAHALFLLPLPLIWKAFTSDPGGLALYLLALGLMLLSAWLTREGLIAHDAYDARKVARRPAFPRKMAGAVLCGAGLALAGLAGHGVLAALIFAVLGVALHFLSFGPDPMRDKGMEGIDTFQQDRVARVVDNAEGILAGMTDAAKRAGDRTVMARLERFEATARDMFRIVEEDPRDLTSARRFLSVYLEGARDATIRFADIYARTPDAEAKRDYLAFLDDLDQSFAARSKSMLLDDRTDMTVEIETLRDRLEREGLTTER